MRIRTLYIIFFMLSSFIYAENDNSSNSNPSTNCTNCDIPISNAGEDKTFYIGSTITLDGTSSYDPDDSYNGNNMSYLWDVSGDGIYIINADGDYDSTLAEPMFTFDGYCTDSTSLTEENCCLNNDGCSDRESLDEALCCTNNPSGCSDGLSVTSEECCLSNYIGCSDGLSSTQEDCCLSNYVGCSDSSSSNQEDCCESITNGGTWDVNTQSCSQWSGATWIQSSWDGTSCTDGSEIWTQSSWDGTSCTDGSETWTQSSWDGISCTDGTATWTEAIWNAGNCLGSYETWETSSNLTFSLIVNDGDYNSDADEVEITVVNINTAPLINVPQTVYEVNKGAELTIDASASYDNTLHTDEMTFDWDYTGFTCPSNQCDNNQKIITLLAPDNITVDTQFYVDLIVADGAGDFSLQQIDVLVIANIIPFAAPGENITVGAGSQFILDGTNSYDPDGAASNLTYIWTSIDPGIIFPNDIISGSAASPSLTIQAPVIQGDYEFSLVVNDGDDDSNEYNSTDLFISEYVEGSSSDRYLEIYNGTENTITLSDYIIRVHRDNGSILDVNLDYNNSPSNNNGLLDSGSTLLILKSTSADVLGSNYLDYPANDVQFIGVGTSSSSAINRMTGDDAVELLKNGTRIDIIGFPVTEPGYVDPGGSGWNVGDDPTHVTKDFTLVRKDWVTDGATSWSDNPGVADCVYDDATTDGCAQWNVFDKDTFDYGGSHYCATCDNKITVSVLSNSAPNAQAGDDFSAFVGSVITLDGSASTDPEGDDLTYSWTCNNTGFTINNAGTQTPSFTVPGEPNGTILVFTLEVTDGVSTSTDNIQVTVMSSNSPPVISYLIEKMTFDGNDVSYNGDVYEDHVIYINASASEDTGSSTGILTYLWTSPEFDYNGDGESDIVFSDETIANPTFEMGEYFQSDRIYDITLAVSDGDQTATQLIQINLIARMPIIDVANTAVIGYEGDYVRLEVLTSYDPNGSIDDLEFDWSGSNSDNMGVCVINDQIADNDGDLLGSANYDNDQWCNSNSDCSIGSCSREKAVIFRLIDTSIGQNTDIDITVEAEDQEFSSSSGYETEEASIILTALARYPVANAGVDKTYTEGTEVVLNGLGTHDPQEAQVIFSYWDDDGTWENDEEDDVSGIVAFYDGSVMICSDYDPLLDIDKINSCVDDTDCNDSDCVAKLIAKSGYTFTWTADTSTETLLNTYGYSMNSPSDPAYHFVGNDVNPIFVIPGYAFS